MNSARVRTLLLALAFLLPPFQAPAAPSAYTGKAGEKTVYEITVTGNALVGRTRKPMALYKNVEYKVRGWVHEEVLQDSKGEGLLLKLSYENKSLTAKLAGVETGLFEYFVRPFMPNKDQPITLRVPPPGGVSQILPSAAGYSSRIAASFLAACLRPPLPKAGLKSGGRWTSKIPSSSGQVPEFQSLFMNLAFKSQSAQGGWWEIEEDGGTLSVRVQDSEEGSPAQFKASGRIRLGPGLKPRWGRFTTELKRTGPEAAPSEKCDILVEVREP